MDGRNDVRLTAADSGTTSRKGVKAALAYEETGQTYSPSPTWEWAAKSDSVLNWRGDGPMSETFGPFVSRESSINTLRSKKYRHELHMLSLPAAVAAMATAYGYDHPGFPLTELLRPEEEILWDRRLPERTRG